MPIKKDNILFRADSSFSIGTGHIMRDLVLAQEFLDYHIFFAVQNLSGNINNKIVEKGYDLLILKSNSTLELIQLIKKFNIKILIIDHYGIDYNDEKQIKEATGVKLFVLDDTYEKHFCDTLLNHNISADITKYKNLLPSHCEIRCGGKYTLLRDEFYNTKIQKRDIKNKDNINILVAMGGADSQRMNISVLEHISNLTCNINIITTSANRHLNMLNEYVKDKENIHVHIDSKKIANILNESDIAIVTPSVIVNEVCFMKIPFIAIMVAENQFDMFDFLTKKGFFTLKKDDLNHLEKYVKELFNTNVYDEQVTKIEELFR